MDDVISEMQGGPELQHRVFYGAVHALKWLLRTLPGDSKDLVSARKLLLGEGEWNCVKEFQGRTIYTETGRVAH